MEFKADLSNCDREPIHIPGKIQSHGVLLAVTADLKLITHSSSNIFQFFGMTASDILHKPFNYFIEQSKLDIEASNLEGFIHSILSEENAENTLLVKTKNNKSFYMILNRSDSNILIEFEPVLSQTTETSQSIMESLLTKILGAKSLEQTLHWSAQQIKDIIGYDRVMIYKFAEDGHGEVVAEALENGFESFMGLHYPASDIPKQARELYKRNLVRIIADVNATDASVEVLNNAAQSTPLDLTDSVLRAVSPIHVQYLKNMGVKASFSVSLISEGELWGLIACHNYEPCLIDYKKRNSCKVIGQLLSTSLTFRETEEEKEQKSIYRDKMLEMVKKVRLGNELIHALTGNSNNLLSINQATGAAIIFEGKVHRLGKTPSEEEIKNIARWLHDTKRNQLFQTTQLSHEYEPALTFKEVASGLLSCALSRELEEYIFWFKKEIAQTVRWAGNPNKPVEPGTDGMLQLNPRHSFEVWTQEVSGVSAPWHNNEIVIAMKFREELVHYINERANQLRKLNEQLKQAYEELDTFSFTISHDLKTSLSSIKNYAELLLDSDEYDATTTKKMLEKIVKGADKMNLLIKEVLGYSRIGRQMLSPDKINMKEMLDEIKSELEIAYHNESPDITIENTIDIYGDRVMMYQVFSNLMGNAVKYSSQKQKAVVSVNAVSTENDITYTISDNGIGIDMHHGDQIFELFKRMGNAGSIEGSGVGLAIVKRILEKHQARIWYDSEPGNGTIFYIRIKKEQNAD